MLSEYIPFVLVLILYGAALGYAFIKLTEYIATKVESYSSAVIISMILVAIYFMYSYNIIA